MACSCCAFSDTAGQQFTREDATAELSRYHKKGPGPTTKLLLEGLSSAGPVEGSVLDVGGGIGALSFELLDQGAERAMIVDASAAYLDAAAEESKRRDRAGVIQMVPGDFVTMAERVPPAAIVTLDRVVCCYPDYEALIRRAAEHAEKRLAYSYPRDRWFVRLGVWAENALRQLCGKSFRAFVHPPERMEEMIRGAGFKLVRRQTTLAWSADVFVRLPSSDARHPVTSHA